MYSNTWAKNSWTCFVIHIFHELVRLYDQYIFWYSFAYSTEHVSLLALDASSLLRWKYYHSSTNVRFIGLKLGEVLAATHQRELPKCYVPASTYLRQKKLLLDQRLNWDECRYFAQNGQLLIVQKRFHILLTWRDSNPKLKKRYLTTNILSGTLFFCDSNRNKFVNVLLKQTQYC